MIVCSCNAIREDELRAVVRQGACSAEAAYRALGCEFECGSCADYADEIVDEERCASRGGKVLKFPQAA